MKKKAVLAGLAFLTASLTTFPALWSMASAYRGAAPGWKQAEGVFGRGPDFIPAALKARKYAEVILACLESIERNPADEQAYFWLNQALEQQEESAGSSAILQVIGRLDHLARDHPDHAHVSYGLGMLHKMQKNFPLARRYFKDAISRGAAFWPVFEEYVTGYQTKNDIDEIAGYLRTLLDRRPSDAFLLQAVGLIQYYSSRFPDALTALEKARAIWHEGGDGVAEGRCLVILSEVLTYSNDYPGALETARQALQKALENGDKWLESRSRESLAFIWHDMGDIAKAEENCRQALALSREIGHRKLESLCMCAMGVIELDRGNLAEAEDLLTRAAEYHRKNGGLRSHAVCLYWRTIVHRQKGDYSRAMSDAKAALEISRRIDFKTSEAFDLTEIGNIHLALGDYERALEFNKEALGLTENPIGKWSREECLNTIGYVYAELEDFGKALEYFQAAYEYIEHIGHRREEARCLYNIGYACFKLGDVPRASEFFKKSLDAADAAGKKIIQVNNYNRLGDLYRLQGAWDKAGTAYGRAQAIGVEIGQPSVIWETCAGLGALQASQKKYEPAIANYKKAIGIIEDLRVQLLLRDYSAGFFESKIPIYEALVNLLFEKEEADPSPEGLAECFAYVEKARARSFLDDLQKTKIDFGALSREENEELETISRRISRHSAGLTNASLGPEARAELRDELEKAKDDFQAFIETAKAKNSVYINAAYRDPRRLSEIRERLLDKETGLIEYFVAGDYLCTFVVTVDGFSVHRLPPRESRDALQLAQDYIRLVSSREIANSDVAPAGRRLYEALLGPVVRKRLNGLKNLIIVPDRALNYLPFETLVTDEGGKTGPAGFRFLLEDYRISYAPSASTLVSILDRGERPEAGMDLLSVGSPLMSGLVEEAGEAKSGENILLEYYRGRRFALQPLEFASREMSSISRRVAREYRSILSRGQATEDRVKAADLAGFKILHFATHSLLDENAAGRSALVLAREAGSIEDGFLQAGEIYNLKLNADLVVLSACQTARGKMGKGEGVQGLARAFFCAGSKSVLASLWNINDRSTATFMKLFYGGLAGGKTVQEALRLAKVEMCRSGNNRPYYWAAFVLIGKGNFGIPLHPASFWSRIL
jgi:CHAT domain-containing protein/Tfp pilus assembly protein PilF